MKCVSKWIPLKIRVRSRNTQPHLKALKKSWDFWFFFGFFEPNRVEPFTREYLNYSNITWKRSLILKNHGVSKIFSKPRRIKKSPATGVRYFVEPILFLWNMIFIFYYTHWQQFFNFVQFFEFRNDQDAYLSKTTNPCFTHTTSAA